MALSNDLINQFVKATNDKPEKSNEAVVYGTVQENTRYVKLDGSDILTPVSTTVVVASGDRVTVMIKNHTATITGNVSNPAAREVDTLSIDALNATYAEIDTLKAADVTIQNKLTANSADIETLQADNVTIKDTLTANSADIGTLKADNATIKETLTTNTADIGTLKADNATINETLTAHHADIETLKAGFVDADTLMATYATIASLNAAKGDINNLKSSKADITSLNAALGRIDTLEANSATILDLDAVKGNVTDLTSEVADINTLIFGSASGDVIQTSFANAVIAQLGNAQIKSAMIENISASKITSGDIITNNVRVKSEDGSLIISDETLQISDSTRVRVQIGKDASNDYSINIWDDAGNLMFSKGGITDSAIKEAIIRNDMVSDTANIAAHKLDIDSLFEEINGSSNTIKSTKVYLDDDGQTLDVSFKELTTDVAELSETVSSQGTEISVIQGQISSKVWQEDISTATDALETQTSTLSTQYSTLSQEVDSISATVASHTIKISTKADSSTVTEVNDKVTSLESDLDGFKTTVSETYTTKTEFNNLEIGGRNYLLGSDMSIDTDGVVLFDMDIDELNKHLGEEVVISVEYEANEWVGRRFGVEPSVYLEDGTHRYFGAWKWGSCDGSGRLITKTTMPNIKIASVSQRGIYIQETTSGSVTVRRPKFEFGNKVTDWTPAPEDVEVEVDELASRMTTAETSITQNSEAIELRATKTEVDEVVYRVTTAESNITQNTDSIEAVVSRTSSIENRLDTAETSISQNTEAISLRATKTELSTAKSEAISSANENTSSLLKNYSTKSEMNSAIEAKADSITSSVSATYATIESVDSIEIGGRNILPESSFTNSRTYIYDYNLTWEYSDDAAVNGTRSITATIDSTDETITNKGLRLAPSITNRLILNKEYIFSFYGKGWETEKSIDFYTSSGLSRSLLKRQELSNGWIRYHVLIKRTGDTTYGLYIRPDGNYPSNGTVLYFNAPKIEEGNKLATAWSPAPEDMASSSDLSAVETRVTSAESTITHLSNSITANVTETEGLKQRMTTMEQNAEGFTWSIDESAIVSSVNEYYQSTSATALSGGSWSTTQPTWTQGKYIWSRTKNTNGKGTVSYTTAVCITGNTGADGNTGATGATGTGISSITREYYVSTSKTTQTEGSWSTATPVWSSGKYVWIRDKIVYTNPASTKYTTPICDSSWEAVNEISVGGTNILRGTNTVSALGTSSNWTNGTWRSAGGGTGTRSVIAVADAPNPDIKAGFQVVGNNDDSVVAQDNVPITDGATYTLSCYAKGTGSLKLQIGKSPYDWKTFTLSGVQTWTKYSYTFVAGLGDYGDGNGITNGKTNIYAGNYAATGTLQFCGLKLETGNRATDWCPSSYEIEDAAKTATNYMNFSSSGLVIGDMTASTLGRNVLIDSDSVDIRNGETTLASFGEDYLYLAKNSRNAKIDLCNGLATMYHASKYSYDTMFVIDTGNTTEIKGLITPLCITSTDDFDTVSVQFANADGVKGGIGIVGSWLRRYESNMTNNHIILDTGNFDDAMDSGWINLVPGDNFIPYNTDEPIQYRKIGKIVHVSGVVKPMTAIAGSTTNYTICTLPEGCRPKRQVSYRCQGSGANTWLFTITAAGSCRFARYGNGSSYVEAGTGTWLPFNATFFTE